MEKENKMSVQFTFEMVEELKAMGEHLGIKTNDLIVKACYLALKNPEAFQANIDAY